MSLHQIRLVAYNDHHTPAQTHKCDNVKFWASANNQITIDEVTGKSLRLRTANGGHVVLQKHISQNYYHGVIKGYKVQVSLKKIVGELRYWG